MKELKTLFFYSVENYNKKEIFKNMNYDCFFSLFLFLLNNSGNIIRDIFDDLTLS